jgi:hypothetical protein
MEDTLKTAELKWYSECMQFVHTGVATGNDGQTYGALLYARYLDPENQALLDRIKSFEEDYRRRMKFSYVDNLYHQQMYYLAAMDYEKGNLEKSLDKLQGLLRANVTQPEATFMWGFLMDKFMVDRTLKF